MEFLERRFGYVPEVHFFPSGKRKVRAVVKEGSDVKAHLKGVYVGKKAPYGFIISIEGSYLVGKGAKRNVVELDELSFRRWMLGEDLELNLPEKGIYLVRFQEAFAGSGYYDGKILKNLMPRVRLPKYQG